MSTGQRHRSLCASLLGLWLAAAASGIVCADGPAEGPSWPDTFTARLEALALLETLNGDLLSHDSATETLQHWCESHRLAPDPRILAVRVHREPKAPTDEQRVLLHAGPEEPIRYRHVQLKCGSLVLSEADNWYVPGRLTPAMNRLLESTDTPFGVIVHDTHFYRHTISTQLLWMPLAPGWEMNPAESPASTARLSIPAQVLEHRAVLTLQDGTPFSTLIETYTGNVLAFPLPAVPH
jgi:hypothetical protein